MSEKRSLRIVLVHSELMAGGAERVMLDAALELQQRGHSVTFLAGKNHQQANFPEFLDGTVIVHELCRWMPRLLFGRLRAACTLARATVLSLRAWSWRGQFDVILCDQVPHLIPVLRRCIAAPVLYYCHFPDRLLVRQSSVLRHLYRWPIDHLEFLGSQAAGLILVNSAFTALKFSEAFPGLPKPQILHPGVQLVDMERGGYEPGASSQTERNGLIEFVSLARIEPAKNLLLAVDAMGLLKNRLPAELFARLRLTLAGSYDALSHESVATLKSLRERAEGCGLDGKVQFILNCDQAVCRQLLSGCRAFIYTPIAEHFGMAPLEAMAAARPVIAVAGGGPAETVCDGETGFLSAPDAEAFAGRMETLVLHPGLAQTMGEAGRKRVGCLYQRDSFGRSMEQFVLAVAAMRPAAKPSHEYKYWQ